MSKILYRDKDKIDVDKIDESVVNKWRWEWMQRAISIDVKKLFPKIKWKREDPLSISLKDCIRKIELPGKAICLLCNKSEVKYGSNGVSALLKHVRSHSHVEKEVVKINNFTLPGSGPAQNITERYGAPPVFHGVPEASAAEAPQPMVHILDRVANMEAMVTAFVAEKSLSFPMAQAIIDLSKELSKDPQALKRLSMFKTTASYKLVYGTSKTLHDHLIKKLKNIPFSLNMDESTASNNMRVCTVLVCYYNDELGEIVTEHLDSFDAPNVDSETLYKELLDLFARLELPWDNLLAILMDSCSVMRGSKTGLEKRIRDTVAPHLLDIDGDSCHHIHNIVKIFTNQFDFFLEKLFQDIYRDFDLSSHLLKKLSLICYHLNLKFRVPQNYIAARWLSIFNITLDFSYMRDAYMVFYYSFCADSSEKSKAMCKIFDVYKVSTASQLQIRNEQKLLSKKKFTKKGKARKMRIVDKLLEKDKVTLLCGLYESVLPLFKIYVQNFQKSSPMVHKLYYEQIDLFKQFLSYFLTPSAIAQCNTGKMLLNIPFTNDNFLKEKHVFVGNKCKELLVKLAKRDDKIVDWFYKTTAEAYKTCGNYAKGKLPLRNKTLKTFAAISPEMILSQKECVMQYLLQLSDLLPHVLNGDEKDNYEKEVRKLMCDNSLPSNLTTDKENKEVEVEIMLWWSSIGKKYPTTFKMVTSVLSVFHGPKVESSFSIMGDVIDKKSNKISDKTFSAIQTVKYSLTAKHPAPCSSRAVKVFSRANTHFTPVDPTLTTNMRIARAQQKSAQSIEKKKKDDQDAIYGKTREIDDELKKTRKTLATENAHFLMKSQAEHRRILEKAYKPKRRKSPSKDESNPKAQGIEEAEDEADMSKKKKNKKRKSPSKDESNSNPDLNKKKKKKRPQQVSLEYCVSQSSGHGN